MKRVILWTGAVCLLAMPLAAWSSDDLLQSEAVLRWAMEGQSGEFSNQAPVDPESISKPGGIVAEGLAVQPSKTLARPVPLNSFKKSENSGSAKDSQKIRTRRRGLWLTHILAGAWTALNGLDLYTTFKALKLGAEEANPIARFFLKIHPLALVAFKALTTLAVVSSAYSMAKHSVALASIFLPIVSLPLLAVVLHNFAVIAALKGLSS